MAASSRPDQTRVGTDALAGYVRIPESTSVETSEVSIVDTDHSTNGTVSAISRTIRTWILVLYKPFRDFVFISTPIKLTELNHSVWEVSVFPMIRFLHFAFQISDFSSRRRLRARDRPILRAPNGWQSYSSFASRR